MKLLKPSWVSHDGNSIFSLDIHPDGSRFATGGLGDDCGRIVVWNMAPVIDEDDEKNENVPKMLCQMDNHLACVNCVRWSNNGRYLASAGDDKVIMIWQTGRYAGTSSVFGSTGGKVNVEQWRCVNTLRGHSGDILDMAWSPHDAWLASCSVDNSVIVWNAQKMPEILSVLKGHTGLVKGVSWDPVGKYLASQSDDKTLRIWRTSDWHLEAKIVDPFKECGGTTHVLRLSWSPDGQYLVSAHAMNNAGPTAQIIDRDGWRTEKDFVGHRKAITCVRFNPNILSKAGKVSGKVHHYCCCAIGSRDRSLSIWLTSLKRPLVVVHDLFANSILDVSWNSYGDQLMACSGDGSVAFLSFDKQEIGESLGDSEKNAFYQKMYGKGVMLSRGGGGCGGDTATSANTIIENPEMLLFKKNRELEQEKLQQQEQERQQKQQQQQQQQQQQLLQLQQSPDDSNKTSSQVKGPVNCQIETRTADGRRRITPMFISPSPDLGDAPQPFNSRSQPTFSSSTERQSRIVIEKRDETSQRCISAASNNSNAGTSFSETATSRSSPGEQQFTAKPVIATNGFDTSFVETPKAPVLITAAATPDTAPNVPHKLKPATSAEVPKIPDKSKESTKASITRPPESRVKEMTAVSKLAAKRGPGRPPISEKLVHHHQPTAQEAAAVVTTRTLQTHNTPQDLRLPPLKAEAHLSVQVRVGGSKSDRAFQLQLEVQNGIEPASAHLHRLRCTTNDSASSWEALLPARGVAIAASKHLVCAACEDGSLSIYSVTGQRLLPSLVLSSSASRLICNGFHVMVVTSRGSITVWDMRVRSALVKNESLSPILRGSLTGAIINATLLTDMGCPVVILSTGKSFTFSVEMGCWMLLHDAADVVQQCSDHHACQPSDIGGSQSQRPLTAVLSQSKKLVQQSRRRLLFRTEPSLQQASTLGHIDQQLSASLVLKSAAEYKFWLLTLARYLVQEGFEARLREICDFLLCSPSTPKTEFHVLGIRKCDLLKEVLLVVGSKLQLQRLYTEYQEQLDVFGKT